MLSDKSVSLAKDAEVRIFPDASDQAITASAYMKVTDNEGNFNLCFLMGKGTTLLDFLNV